MNQGASSRSTLLLPEILSLALSFLESAELLRISPTRCASNSTILDSCQMAHSENCSLAVLETVCSLLRARMLSILHAPSQKGMRRDQNSIHLLSHFTCSRFLRVQLAFVTQRPIVASIAVSAL